ncbi:ankyrin repeat-containing domain protein [Apiosordaria backusii]|uniref:Ankyrin repeat-containing domain protein n=1 Tax=Apiosordaria backusii TaxID=314023 RepID=A0AA40K415_9PEZI|nr:ankyrin repeat-containing domain protein [Apiosordaria backusii]
MPAHRCVGFVKDCTGPGVFDRRIRLGRHYYHQPPTKPNSMMAAQLSIPLISLYTQHIYAGFMRELAGHLHGHYNEEPKWRVGSLVDNKSVVFANKRITQLVQYLQETQLFTSEEAYLAIIPPISKMGKLETLKMCLRNELLEHHRNRRYDEVGMIFQELLEGKPESDRWIIRHPKFFGSKLSIEVFALLWSYANLIPESYSQHGKRNQARVFQYDYRQLKPFRLPIPADIPTFPPHWRDLLPLHFDNSFLYLFNPWTLTPSELYDEFTKTPFGGLKDRCHHHKLHQAFKEGSENALRDAFKTEDIGAKDIWGWNALHYAAHHMTSAEGPRLPYAIKIVEGWPSMIIAPDLMGWTPLHHAARNPGSKPFLRYLADRKKDYDLKAAPFDESTPLHCAADAGAVNNIEFFIPGHASCITPTGWFLDRDHIGFQPLHKAILGGHVETTTAIWNYGVDELDWSGQKVGMRNNFHLAAWSGKKEILEVLWTAKEYRELINDKDENGLTPLHMAVAGEHVNFVKALIDRSTNGLEADTSDPARVVDLNLGDEAGFAALDIAKKCGYSEIARLLEEAGAQAGNPKEDDS